jgi:DNA-3-methyladenine glycosylase II
VTGNQFTSVLPARAPFALAKSLRVIGGFAPCSGEQELSAGTVRKAFALADGRAAVLSVTAAPDGVAVSGQAAGPLDRAAITELEAAVTSWLSLDDDLTEFLAIAAADPAMREVLAVTRGLHQLRFASLAEGAAYFVLTQRTSQQLAGARKRQLAAAFGPRIELDGREWIAFPPLDLLAGLGPEQLAPFTGNARQTEYLGHVLRGVHELGEEFLRTAPYAEADQALRTIRGVGDFTAGAILLRALGRPDAVPLEMGQFAKPVAQVYGDETPIEAVRNRYGRYVGWWSYFTRIGLGWLGEDRRPAVK